MNTTEDKPSDGVVFYENSPRKLKSNLIFQAALPNISHYTFISRLVNPVRHN
ncbi:hypothetical protein SAMN05444380_1105 [Thermophagus xiamenensis]|uniref:Uncharacterized protein n=1 Tax=Thermophagus xiamenensis TaxID=385682 RepID=A0A1I1ZSN6_9BACT|nr:hypothetical protein SAMN05444380_1105 [Thermophagus xiamenensis]